MTLDVVTEAICLHPAKISRSLPLEMVDLPDDTLCLRSAVTSNVIQSATLSIATTVWLNIAL